MIIEAMMANSKKKGEPGYFGQWVQNTKNQNLFYKAPFHACDADFLSGHNVSRGSYEAAFNREVTSSLPVGSVYRKLDEWEKVYNEWLDAAPEGLYSEAEPE